MALRFVVEGTVYMLAAREAVALARALRLRAMPRAVPDDALAAAVMIEAALEVPRAAAIMFTEREAAEVVRAARGRRQRALYRALRGNFVVDHTQYDTTSILATIEARYGLAPLSTRDAAVNDLSNVFAAKQVEAGS